MKNLSKFAGRPAIRSAFAASLFLTALAPVVATPAAAQQIVPGAAVVNLPAAVASSNANIEAEKQRPITYKPHLDQATTRAGQLEAQLKPLYDKIKADQAANVDNAALQQQAAQISQIEQAGERELKQILQPLGLSRAYVREQIEDLLHDAVKTTAEKKKVTLILDASAGAVVFADAKYNVTQDVIDELNILLPTAQLVPPPGWMPREMREQQEAIAAARAASGQTAAPADQQPVGR